jgi:hypothetical protein
MPPLERMIIPHKLHVSYMHQKDLSRQRIEEITCYKTYMCGFIKKYLLDIMFLLVVNPYYLYRIRMISNNPLERVLIILKLQKYVISLRQHQNHDSFINSKLHAQSILLFAFNNGMITIVSFTHQHPSLIASDQRHYQFHRFLPPCKFFSSISPCLTFFL